MASKNVTSALNVQYQRGIFYTEIGKKLYRIVQSPDSNGRTAVLLPIISLQDEILKRKARQRLLARRADPLA